MTRVEIISWLWNDPKAKHTPNFTYGPDHVNKLYRRLEEGRKRLPSGWDIRFNVISDHPTVSDFDANIRYVPLWPDYRELGRCFTRLPLFNRERRAGYLGFTPDAIVISIDVDIVITKPEEFLRVLLKNHKQAFTGYRDSKNPACYSGALWKLDPRYGDVSHVHKSFEHIYGATRNSGTTEAFFKAWNSGTLAQDPETGQMVNIGYVGSDQSWVVNVLGEYTYPRKINDLEDGVWDAWAVADIPGGELPANACAVFVNGMRRDPSLPEWQEKYPWVKKYWGEV